VIALGFFDGVHRGHGALLEKAAARAKELDAVPAVLTFDVHPDNFITGENLRLLNTAADRDHILRRYYGIEDVLVAHFDDAFMHTPWEQFVERDLRENYGAVHVIAGHDFHFGYRGEGNPRRLQEKCRELGMGCDIIPKVERCGITVSSTYIRGLVAQGEMEQAGDFLGHPHLLSGTVVTGRQLGRTIGIPTVNFPLPAGILAPRSGVYTVLAELEDGRVLPGVTNVGVKPTVEDTGVVSVETHLLDFDGDLYGRQVRLAFFRFLRPETKFESIAALQTAIRENIAQTRTYFAEHPESRI